MKRIGFFELGYKQIPAYADEARKGQPVRLKLGRIHSALYRWLIQREVRAHVARPSSLRFAADLAFMLLILVAAKRLVLLAYYHEESLKSYQSIRFEPTTDGIFVWFNQPQTSAPTTRIDGVSN